MQTPAGTIYRFGPFEVNAASGELLKQGKRVRLQEQPFRLLVILLENSGQVVAHEEIEKRLWEGTTFVDFDSSLRVAVRKLREALGDDADNPHYIETIPKRGYRFLGPASRQADSLPRFAAETSLVAEQDSTKPARFKNSALLVSILLCIAAGAGAFRFFSRNSRILTAKDTVVLADFTNTTGDPLFDVTLRQGMAIQLEQSPFLSLLSEGRIQQTLRLMGQAPDARLTPVVAREICVRTASTAVLDGSITSLGSQYVLGLRAIDCQTGDALAEEQVQAAKKEEVLNALGQVASKLRTRVGESLITVEKHNTPLAEATTPSLDALRAYSVGVKVLFSTSSADAIPFFKRATEIDPKFAMAHAMLGRVYGDLGESALSAESTSQAYQLRDRASDEERFFIALSYDLQVTGNLEKAQQTCEQWIQTYPRGARCRAMLAGEIYPSAGKYEEAADEAKKAIEEQPDLPFAYESLAYSYESLGRIDDAEATLQTGERNLQVPDPKASGRTAEFPDFLLQRYDLAFLKGSTAEMEREAAVGHENPQAEWMFDHEAFVQAYSGHLQRAMMTSQRAADLAKQSAQPEEVAMFESVAALWEGLFGKAHSARQGALAALKLSKNRDAEYGAAFALALSGDSQRSLILANDLESRFPEDTSVKFSYLPALRGLRALHYRDPAKAIEVLQVAVPYDLGAPRSSIHAFFGSLYPVYVRGEAYLAAQRGAEAAAEFKKILDHRGIVVSDPIGALAYLQIGRAYAMQGDTTKATSAYRDFLDLWKDADAELPVLEQAKAEYAKLR